MLMSKLSSEIILVQISFLFEFKTKFLIAILFSLNIFLLQSHDGFVTISYSKN